jgi:hypothetical protein
VPLAIGDTERKLLLLCARRDPVPTDEIRDLALRPLDWNAIFVTSLWHKVAFIAYGRLGTTGALDAALADGNLPLLLLNHWKQLAKANALRSELYAEAAREICSAAESCSVDLVVAKGGVALFGWAYTPAERKSYDVDFIGRREDMRGIEEALRRCGFDYGEYSHASESIDPPRPGDLRKHLLQGRGLPNFLRKPDSRVIDYLVAQVRFRVGSGAGDGRWIVADPLLDRAETRDGIRVACWPDLALQLALHLHREAHETEYRVWNLDWNLVKLCDFDRVLHMPGVGPITDDLVDRAVELGFTRELAFAAKVTGTVFPSSVLNRVIESCGIAPEEGAEGYDEDAIQQALWSVGERFDGQRSAWQSMVGAKTT